MESSSETNEQESKLMQLFETCDASRKGYLELEDIRKLCDKFGISTEDSSLIFEDLDHDNDGKINFADFYLGFCEFFHSSNTQAKEGDAYHKCNFESNRRKSVHNMWQVLTSNLNNSNLDWTVHLPSQEKLLEIYEELQDENTSPSLIAKYEETLKSLFNEMQSLHRENQALEKIYRKQTKNYETNLQLLEEEMDAQVTQIEAKAKENADANAKLNRRRIQEDLDSQMSEFQNYMHLFDKVDNWLKKQEAFSKHERKPQLENYICENMQLKRNMNEIQKSMALLRTEMEDLKSQYEYKCSELCSERDMLVEYIEDQKSLQRQLELMQQANRQLYDNNEVLHKIISDSGVSSDDLTQSQVYFPMISSSIVPIDMQKTLLTAMANGKSSKKIYGRSGQFEKKSPLTHSLTFSASTKRRKSDDFMYYSLPANLLGHCNSACDLTKANIASKYKSIGASDIGTDELDANRIKTHEDGSVIFSIREFPNSSKPSPRDEAKDSSDCIPDHLLQSLAPTGPPERSYKIIFTGDASVGKTSFIIRIQEGKFTDHLRTTLGVDFYVKTLNIDGVNISLQFWDTAGAVTYEHTGKQVPIILCGNKTDERHPNLKTPFVTTEQGREVAEKNGVFFMEISAKKGKNLYDTIIQLTRQMMLQEENDIQSSIITLLLHEKENTKKCCSN